MASLLPKTNDRKHLLNALAKRVNIGGAMVSCSMDLRKEPCEDEYVIPIIQPSMLASMIPGYPAGSWQCSALQYSMFQSATSRTRLPRRES